MLDTLEMALWTRQRDGIPLAAGMIHHHAAGSQYTSFAFTSRLFDASVGSVGDGYDCENVLGHRCGLTLAYD